MAYHHPIVKERHLHGDDIAEGLATDDRPVSIKNVKSSIKASTSWEVDGLGHRVGEQTSEPDVQGQRAFLSLLSEVAQWILLMAPVLFLGQLPSISCS
jgi:hypothetical protein